MPGEVLLRQIRGFAMCFDTVKWAFEQPDLKPAEKLVLLVLADHRNKATQQCVPSQSTLASRCNMSVSAVNRHLRSLHDKGLIRRKRRKASSGANISTEYGFPKC